MSMERGRRRMVTIVKEGVDGEGAVAVEPPTNESFYPRYLSVVSKFVW